MKKLLRRCFKMSLRVDFINQVVKLNSSTKFQYWFNNYPSKSWFNYGEMLQKHSQIFNINNQILRSGIETEEMQELRIDLDIKLNGEKHLMSCIDTFKYISTIFNRHNLKYSLYYSAGAGLHIHLLYNSKTFQEFKNTKKVRELICEYLGIKESLFEYSYIFKDLLIKRSNIVDTQLLSNNQMLTCEGYHKRKSKTKEYKIYIHSNIQREEREKIFEYILMHKFNDELINFNFFKEINTFSDDIVKYVKDKYKAHTPQNQRVREPNKEDFFKSASEISSQNEYKATHETIIKHLVTFSKLYNQKGIGSANQIYTIVISYLFSATQRDENKTLEYFNMFFDVFKVEDMLNCSREKKVEIVCERFREGYTKIFFNNKYFSKEEFYKEYYKLFPKNNSVVKSSVTNEHREEFKI